MPPRRSHRPKRPSTHALEAIASTPTRRTRQSAAGPIQASESVGSGANQSSVKMGSGANQSSVSMGSGANQSSVSMGSGANPSSVSVGSGAISEELISSIVTRVTAAVTRQLTSPSLPNPVPPAEESQPLSSQSNIEVPVVQALADLPPAGTALHAPTSNTYSSTSATSQLANVASFLLCSSLQPSSIPTYQRAWKIFQQFFNSTFQHPFSGLPISPSVLALFIAYLFNAQYAPSTVTTYVSTLGYVHKLMGFPDPSKVFYVSQILKGYSKVGFRLDSRLPITLPIFDRLVSSANSLQGSVYQMCQFQAMCSLAFYAFLHIGEITSAGGYSNPLQLSQLTKLLSPGGDLTAFKLTFGDYKHCYKECPFSLIVSHQTHSCPVQFLSKYLATRGSRPGPIFITVDGLPVSRSTFSNQLATAIQLCGLPPARYKGHSFRIGAASHAAEHGFTDTQIRLLGRWKSNAFQKYLRVPSLSS